MPLFIAEARPVFLDNNKLYKPPDLKKLADAAWA
jgi:hypothetical protein